MDKWFLFMFRMIIEATATQKNEKGNIFIITPLIPHFIEINFISIKEMKEEDLLVYKSMNQFCFSFLPFFL